MKVYVLYHDDGFHLDGDPFDAGIYGVFLTKDLAKIAREKIVKDDLIESGFSDEEITLAEKNDDLLTEWMYTYDSNIKISEEDVNE